VSRLRLAPAALPRQGLQGAAVALCLIVAAACGTPSSSSPGLTTSEPTGTTVESSADGSSSSSDEPALSASPEVGASTGPDQSTSSSPSAAAHPAADCAGNDENRDFYADIAQSVTWTVYCPTLPDGWVVDTGSYRLANGGKLDITYRNRGGSRLELHEGAFCTDGSGCLPAGSAAGDAQFGDRTGTLIAVGDDTWALSVDAGEPLSWLAVGRVMDEGAFRDSAAHLIRVGD
jgi:hypothetical protein